MDTIQLTEEFTIVNCGKEGCDSRFAVPASVLRRWKETHENWHCPNGHCRCFLGLSEAERLRDELASAKSQLEMTEARLETAKNTRDYYKRSAAVTRGIHRKLKERIAAGICPCCRRTFANLMAHMQHQHPIYRPREGKDEA